jgi:hypothetical protein
VGGGLEFKWNPSSELDHDYYEVQTAVGTGGWGEWVEVQDNYYYRELTSSEILTYGVPAEIYIRVRDVDTFGQVSSHVATNKLSGYVWGELIAGKISSPDGKTYFDLEYPEIHCENPVTGDYSRLSYGALKFFKHGVSTPFWYTRRMKTGIASDGTYITLNWELTPKVSVAIQGIQTWKSTEPGSQYIDCFPEEISNQGFRVRCRLRTESGMAYIDNDVVMFLDGNFQNNPYIQEPEAVTTTKIILEQEIFSATYYGIERWVPSGKSGYWVTDRYKVKPTYKLYYKLHSSGDWIYVGQWTNEVSSAVGWKWLNTIFEDQTAERYDFKLEYVSKTYGTYIDTVYDQYGGYHGSFGPTGYYDMTGGGYLYQGNVLYLALEGG